METRKVISLDTEDTGLDLYCGAKPYLVTICNEDGENKWWEWAVDPLTREPEIIYEDLKDIQSEIDAADLLVLQNAKFDVCALSRVGILEWPWHKTVDTLVSGHMLASNQPHDLTSMALIYCGVNIQPYEDRMEKAVKEARRLVETKDFVERHGEWRIAKSGLPEMPSAKEKVWKYDCWLLRAVALAENYAPNHPWRTLTSDYANVDSAVTLPLYKAHRKLMDKRGYGAIFAESMKLPPILYSMEQYGVTLSESRLEESDKRYKAESENAGRICTNIAASYGFELSLPKAGNNNALKEFIFDKLQLPVVVKTDKGEPSLNKTVFEHYANTLPLNSKPLLFVKSLIGKRKRDTAVQYLEGYKRFWRETEHADYKRLHPSINQTGSDTLRLSSNNPNGQNCSKQEGFNLRYPFGPAPGREWWSIDYDNLELRIPAYYSGEQVMIEIFEKPNEPPYFGSYHLMNASIIYPDQFWPIADNKGEFKERYKATYYQWVKNFGFAVSYGAMEQSGTADRAAHKVGAQRMVMDRLKEHSRLNREKIEFAERYGYVETIPDKTVDPERGYPILCSRSKWGKILPTTPLNFFVQGSAVWVARKAMVRCYEYLQQFPDYKLILNLHDELMFDFPTKGTDNLPIIQEITRLMELSGDDISIPLKVSVRYHPNNWSEEREIPNAKSPAA